MQKNIMVLLMGSMAVIALLFSQISNADASGFDTIVSTVQDESPPRLIETNVQNPIPGRYIVVFKKHTSRRDISNSISQDVVRHGGTADITYTAVFEGFAGRIPEKAIQALLRNPHIDYIEQDQSISLSTTQSSPPWGIDRIDQDNLPLDERFTYTFTGAGVNVYVLDTGIRFSHTDFGGRAHQAFDVFDDEQNGADCNGHGTHVAGIIGGTTYGVAKQVDLYSVRVLDCNGDGTVSGAIEGIDWVTRNHLNHSIANMSLSSSDSIAMKNAINASISSGVVYVVAAANMNDDACNYSPANTTAALTIGSSTITDNKASTSNWGVCLDMFAPGDSILSDWYTNDEAIQTKSGTSMASPHVAGAAALYIQAYPDSDPNEVAQALIGNATIGLINEAGIGSPNLLLNVSFLNGEGTSTPDPSITPPTPTETATFTQTAIASYTPTSSNTPNPSDAPCTSCDHYTGSLTGSGNYQYQPSDSPFYFNGGTLQGWLEGPSGTDFDLQLYKVINGIKYYAANSVGYTSSEYISYNATAGEYIWKISSYSGSGNYDFWMTSLNTPLSTATKTATFLPTGTPTQTSTPTNSPTASFTPTPSPTNLFTATASSTATKTATPTKTPTHTNTPLATNTPSTIPCTTCDHYTGSLTGSGNYQYQPSDSPFYFNGGTLQGWLEGPSGTDFDLQLYKVINGIKFYAANSVGYTSSEYINYNAAAGEYIWKISSYSGSGNYDFWMTSP